MTDSLDNGFRPQPPLLFSNVGSAAALVFAGTVAGRGCGIDRHPQPCSRPPASAMPMTGEGAGRAARWHADLRPQLRFDGTLDPAGHQLDSTFGSCSTSASRSSGCHGHRHLSRPGRSWEISDDGLTYTFQLKQGVTFHDGTPFNADAVKFTYDRVVEGRDLTAAGQGSRRRRRSSSPGQSFNQIDAYDHAEIVDDYTIKLVLSRPFAPFLTGLNGYLGIVSPTAVEKMGLAEFGRAPVGTGPFKFQEWVDKDHVTLVKNPDYNWGSSFFKNQGAAYLDEMVYKIIPDGAVRTGTLVSGESQYIDEIDPLQLADLQENSDVTIVQQGQPGSGYILLFNVRPHREPAGRCRRPPRAIVLPRQRGDEPGGLGRYLLAQRPAR